MEAAKYLVKQKVWVTVAETSSFGGRHRGVVENIVQDMFDGTILYLVSTCGNIIPAREEALEAYKSKKRKLCSK